MEDQQEVQEVYESLDSYCEAYPLEDNTAVEELSEPLSCLFYAQFRIHFTHIPYDDESGEMFLDQVESSVKEYDVWTEKDRLTNREYVWRLLADMGVPVEPFMVLRIVDCADKMMSSERFKNRKILRMFVEMDVPDLREDEDEAMLE